VKNKAEFGLKASRPEAKFAAVTNTPQQIVIFCKQRLSKKRLQPLLKNLYESAVVNS